MHPEELCILNWEDVAVLLINQMGGSCASNRRHAAVQLLLLDSHAVPGGRCCDHQMRTSRLVSSPAACTRVVLPTHVQCWGRAMCLQVIAGMIRHLLDAYNKPVPAILEIPSKVRRG